MQRKFVAACVLAVCGIFVSSCDLIFGKGMKEEPIETLTGGWIAQTDSHSDDSIFNTSLMDSIGMLHLIFQTDSVMIVKKNDSTYIQIKYYQNSSADSLYVKLDSSLHTYSIFWSSDSSLIIGDVGKTYTFFRE